jgi:hypothetical protein
MVREKVTAKFRIQDPSTRRVYVVFRITEFAVIHGYGGQESEHEGRSHLRTDGYDGVKDLGGGLYSIPRLGVEEAVLIDERS